MSAATRILADVRATSIQWFLVAGETIIAAGKCTTLAELRTQHLVSGAVGVSVGTASPGTFAAMLLMPTVAAFPGWSITPDIATAINALKIAA